MNRLNLIGLLWLTLVAASSVSAKDDDGKPPLEFQAMPSAFRAKQMEVTPQDDELTRAMKNRYNAAAAELAATYRMYSQGKGTLDIVYDAGKRLHKSALELAQPEQRVKLCEDWLEAAIFMEKTVLAKRDASIGSPAALPLAKYHTADARVQLLREKKRLEKSREPK